MSQAPPAAHANTGNAAPAPPSKMVANHVGAMVTRIQGGYLSKNGGPTSGSIQALASLRRARTTTEAIDPRTWALVLDDLPAPLMGTQRSDSATPTAAEQAVLTALATYATHQQSQRTPMHVRGVGLGQATQALARQRSRPGGSSELDANVVDRMHRVAMAQTVDLRAHALRGLVALMRTAQPAIGLDYGLLAADLYWLQHPQYARRVHLTWARGLRARRAITTENPQTLATTESGDQA